MTSTVFVNGVTLSDEDWFNDLNRLHYTIFGDPANIAAIRTALYALPIDLSGASAGQIVFPASQNASSNANTLDDYQEDTFTGTLTGAATAPTGTVNITKIGNHITIEVPSFTGTSNATTKTITGMPVGYRPATQKYFLANTQDNTGSRVVSSCTLDTDGTLTLYASASRATFTASGTFTVDPFTFTYTLL